MEHDVQLVDPDISVENIEDVVGGVTELAMNH